MPYTEEKSAEIQGWKYDFSSLPHWDNREKTPYVTDSLFENPDGSFCVLNYSVMEVSPCDYRGFLAVFKNKQNPELVLNATNINFPQKTPFFASCKQTVAVLASVNCPDISQNIDVTLILDFAKEHFAFAPFYQTDIRELHPLAEAKGELFLINRDGSKRNVKKLKQYPLAKLTSFSGVSIKMNMFGNIQVVPIF